jgi:hypothetical protein
VRLSLSRVSNAWRMAVASSYDEQFRSVKQRANVLRIAPRMLMLAMALLLFPKRTGLVSTAPDP